MNFNDFKKDVDLDAVGHEFHRLIAQLYPICRSITGNGVRETLGIINKHIPLDIHNVPTGEKVFDWIVPKEWNIKDAYIKDLKGKKVIDFKESNLHVVSYSKPVKKKMFLKELKEHIFTLPEHPNWIPYRNSYYNETWGFCLSYKQFLEMKDEEYEVCIDSSLEEGELTYGECFLEGERQDEVLISCHVCHPSLCNDNLSGVSIAAFLARHFASMSMKYSYRFLFHPTTIGSITWLALNEAKLNKIKHGLVLACLGDPGMSTYKKSRRGGAEIDQAVAHVLKYSNQNFEIIDFSPFGYDERQFCSPGFDLPIGCLMRTPNGKFKEYHTSADNLDFVHPTSLADSFLKCLKIFHIIENNTTYVNLNPKCEPRLGYRGLYWPSNTQHEPPIEQLSVLWVLNLSEGKLNLLEIADRAGIEFDIIKTAADKLLAQGLLKIKTK